MAGNRDQRKAGRGQPAIVVMGVSATGKSTIAMRLAQELRMPWLDGDDLHSPANIAKMAAGVPLTDDDRHPWLEDVGRALARASADAGLVVACSALRRPYRDLLREKCPSALFVHLHGDRDLLRARAEQRQHHFMPAGLLDSQLATLEPLEADEAGVLLDVRPPVADVVRAARERLAHLARAED